MGEVILRGVPAVDTHAVPRTSGLGRSGDVRIAVGLVGLGAAVALRVAFAGVAGARSVSAGLAFGAVVGAVAAVISTSNATSARNPPGDARRFAVLRMIGYGVAGAVVLCVPAALRHADGATVSLPLAGFPPWALGVVVVAVAEESLLRGSLFTALQRRFGVVAAVGVTSVAFAAVHAPLYGTSVLPLDLAVGVWLGALRATTGSVTAPGVAHMLADLAGWWLR
jgi:membrane protease YdiL (CAAX protease family)